MADTQPTVGTAGTVVLPARLDLTAAAGLAAILRGSPADAIDASGVTHLGGLCLQLLLAAARAARDRGRDLLVAPRSPAFEAALADFGIGPDLAAGAAS